MTEAFSEREYPLPFCCCRGFMLCIHGPLLFVSDVSANMICSCRKPSTTSLSRLTPSLLSGQLGQLVVCWPAAMVDTASVCPFSAVWRIGSPRGAHCTAHNALCPCNWGVMRTHWYVVNEDALDSVTSLGHQGQVSVTMTFFMKSFLIG